MQEEERLRWEKPVTVTGVSTAVIHPTKHPDHWQLHCKSMQTGSRNTGNSLGGRTLKYVGQRFSTNIMAGSMCLMKSKKDLKPLLMTHSKGLGWKIWINCYYKSLMITQTAPCRGESIHSVTCSYQMKKELGKSELKAGLCPSVVVEGQSGEVFSFSQRLSHLRGLILLHYQKKKIPHLKLKCHTWHQLLWGTSPFTGRVFCRNMKS